jgi:hypothetical protein
MVRSGQSNAFAGGARAVVAQPVSIARLSDSPNGRGYWNDEKEAAYLLWRPCGRSIRKTAEALNLAPSTVGASHRAGGAVERAEREDAEEGDQARASIRGRALPRGLREIELAEKVVDDETAPVKDRLNAAFWLAGIAGIARVKQGDASALADPPRPARPPRDLRSLSDAELRALEEGETA